MNEVERFALENQLVIMEGLREIMIDRPTKLQLEQRIAMTKALLQDTPGTGPVPSGQA